MYRYRKRAKEERNVFRQALYAKGFAERTKMNTDYKSNSENKICFGSDFKSEIIKSRKIELVNINKLRILILTRKSQNEKILIFLPSFLPWRGG
ncbi:MAG TPA: hypothetical protein VJY54_06115 [Lachnospiraceae bacterium]|nr:hypothetical protein [Lachnospiraceae bacterium]